MNRVETCFHNRHFIDLLIKASLKVKTMVLMILFINHWTDLIQIIYLERKDNIENPSFFLHYSWANETCDLYLLQGVVEAKNKLWDLSLPRSVATSVWYMYMYMM